MVSNNVSEVWKTRLELDAADRNLDQPLESFTCQTLSANRLRAGHGIHQVHLLHIDNISYHVSMLS